MVCNPTVQYALYEWLVARWLDAKRAKAVRQYGSPSVKLSALEVFCLSAAAKLGATVSTYPLLVVKNRMQARTNLRIDVTLLFSKLSRATLASGCSSDARCDMRRQRATRSRSVD